MFKWVWLQYQAHELWAPGALVVAATPDPFALSPDA